MLLNPYTPGAGVPPRFLAGRENTIQEAEEILTYIANGYFARSVVYYGLRGVGKTVLLNHIEDMAEEKGIHFEHIEIAERDQTAGRSTKTQRLAHSCTSASHGAILKERNRRMPLISYHG